jgi:putative two-component system response regulator
MKILIAEDDHVSRKKLGFLLKSLGYEVLEAQNGKEAWAIWKVEKPRFIISDWVMPEMDGIELCRKIRNSDSSQYTYFIIVTSKSSTDDIVLGMNAGADDYISKPYVKEELAVRIRAGLRVVEMESRDVIIMAISKLAESRDLDTGQHLERIRFFCKTIAEHLYKQGMYTDIIDEIFIDNIFLTSMLHDIGKIGIPDSILLKPGKLTAEEFERMKKHTLIGYETLKEAASMATKASYLKMSADIALYHHEKYNGQGYPMGLKGEEIPLASRIVALADVYDALRSKRIYKEAFTHEVSRKIILEGKGEHFDPHIVDAFIACEERFLEIVKTSI